MSFKVTITLLLSILLLGTSQAQNHQSNGRRHKQPTSIVTGKITAIIMDSLTQQPIEFATAILIDPNNGKEVDGQISNEKGLIRMIEVPMGHYELVITFLGYQDKRIEVVLTPKDPDVDLGSVYMTEMGIVLQQITVRGEKSAVEHKVDRIVYHADKDITSRGGDASEVLRRVPLLSVDLEGNVSLRGSNNVQILINGRPSGMFSSSVADALKMIPAEEIKSVEVITAPTAKYDGEGSAGIINIITKKRKVEGIGGNLNLSAGNRLNNAVLSLSTAKGRGGMHLNGSTFYAPKRPGVTSFYRRDTINGQVRILDQNGQTQAGRLGFGGSAGAFYDFNAYNGITTRLNYRGFNRINYTTIQSILIDPALSQNEQYTRTTDLSALRYSYDWNTDYRRTWPDSKREWIIGFQLSGHINDMRNNLYIDGVPDALDYAEKALNDGDNKEWTLQTDYTHPLGKSTLIEVGIKAIRRDITSNYRYEVFDSNATAFLLDPLRSDIFHYRQDVGAAYLSANITISDNWGVVAGTRYEYTAIGGSFQSDGTTFSHRYENLLPSIILSRKLKNFQQLRLAYTQRIQRPSLFYINPFNNNSDRRVVQTGNPYLLPEVTDQLELSFNTRLKGVMLNLSTYYKQTRDVIESFLEVTPEGISITTFRNIGRNHSIGTNLFASTTIKEKLTIRGGLNVYTYSTRATVDGQQLSNRAIQYNGNLNANLQLPKGFRAEVFGFWNSPRFTVQGFNASFSLYSFGLSKKIFGENGHIGLRLVEPFNKYKYFDSELRGSNFYQTSSFGILFRSVGINFNYKFGKMEFNPRNKLKNRIKNEDVKEEESAF